MSGDDPRRITDDELALVYEIQKAMRNDGWPTVVDIRRLVNGIASRNPPPDPLADNLKVAICEAMIAINENGDPGYPIIPPTAIDWIGNKLTDAALAVVREWEADDA